MGRDKLFPVQCESASVVQPLRSDFERTGVFRLPARLQQLPSLNPSQFCRRPARPAGTNNPWDLGPWWSAPAIKTTPPTISPSISKTVLWNGWLLVFPSGYAGGPVPLPGGFMAGGAWNPWSGGSIGGYAQFDNGGGYGGSFGRSGVNAGLFLPIWEGAASINAQVPLQGGTPGQVTVQGFAPLLGGGGFGFAGQFPLQGGHGSVSLQGLLPIRNGQFGLGYDPTSGINATLCPKQGFKGILIYDPKTGHWWLGGQVPLGGRK